MPSTTTIRVSTQTRDALATQARARGVSVRELVADLAGQTERAEMFRRERELWRAEAAENAAAAEAADWETTSVDGLD